MRKALILFLSLCLASIGVVPSAAAPVRSEAGLRAYFVLTAPKQTAQVTAAITQNGGTVFATYDAVGVIVVHSTASPAGCARSTGSRR